MPEASFQSQNRPAFNERQRAEFRYRFGQLLQKLRRYHNVAPESLAARAGLDFVDLVAIEQGLSFPKPEELAALAGVLGIPMGLANKFEQLEFVGGPGQAKA